ncbi:glycosyltransferase [Youxingia wuxianensis]|uniref:Glycosyltransferase n=1 Tax=Youxingia wuxianensis TaxID=2763678 RepID=A0A926IHW9_9FIRM|nr:glycosyltransferase [Youxingia wuxianensis]MBC8585103.1 glycosyltransferase [Youxingia wuxianensis]
MRVALFTETYLPHINGVVTHVKSLKDGLEKLGHEVLVVTADATSRKHYIAKGILHCPAHTSKRFYGYGVAMPLSTTRLKLISQFNPDIIHIHNEFGIGLSGIMIAKILHTPLVYTLHTMYDEYIYYVAPAALAGASTKISHKYIHMLANSANALTGPSKKCEEYFRKVGVYNKPVNVIPNPVDLDTFNAANIQEDRKKAFREKFNYTDNMTIAVFVGRLGREKSVDILLDYWAQTIGPQEDIKLLIIGDGPCKEELEEQSRQLGIDPMVTFAGKVMHDEIPPYFACCDFYITASTSDTNSISMLEGMAMGLPVLQITDPLNEGQVKDNINGYIFKDAQDMYDKILKIKNMSPQELDKLKKSTRESVENSGAVNLAQYVLQVYDGAIQEQTHRKHRLKIWRPKKIAAKRIGLKKWRKNKYETKL